MEIDNQVDTSEGTPADDLFTSHEVAILKRHMERRGRKWNYECVPTLGDILRKQYEETKSEHTSR